MFLSDRRRRRAGVSKRTMNSECSDMKVKSTIGKVFMKCPAINPLEDNEWRNQSRADQQRSGEGL